jgi:NAD(P)-dependent dehydrogenase (short-subunit alcohol dehydrogenase family)
MAIDLKGKNVLITGAATGIGRATAQLAADAGASLTLLDVNKELGQKAADELGAKFLPLDVSDPDAWMAVAKDIETPDYAHLNAGVMSRPANDPPEASDITIVNLEDYHRIVGVNINGVVYGLRALAPKMKAKGGTITVTASIAGFVPVPFDAAYPMTKHAMIGLVRSVGGMWGDGPLKINAICPGMVKTAIVPDAMADMPGQMSPETMAAEVIDLFVNGAQGETRVKLADDVPAYHQAEPELGPPQ